MSTFVSYKTQYFITYAQKNFQINKHAYIGDVYPKHLTTQDT